MQAMQAAVGRACGMPACQNQPAPAAYLQRGQSGPKHGATDIQLDELARGAWSDRHGEAVPDSCHRNELHRGGPYSTTAVQCTPVDEESRFRSECCAGKAGARGGLRPEQSTRTGQPRSNGRAHLLAA